MEPIFASLQATQPDICQTTVEDHVNGRSAVRGARRPELQRLEEVVEVQLTAVVLVDLLRQTSGLARAEREGEGA